MTARKRGHLPLPSMSEASVLLCVQGTIIMNHNGVRKVEQIKFIMECCHSGLSDYQWCQNQGINSETFNNWVSKLCKEGYAIFDFTRRVSAPPAR